MAYRLLPPARRGFRQGFRLTIDIPRSTGELFFGANYSIVALQRVVTSILVSYIRCLIHNRVANHTFVFVFKFMAINISLNLSSARRGVQKRRIENKISPRDSYSLESSLRLGMTAALSLKVHDEILHGFHL